MMGASRDSANVRRYADALGHLYDESVVDVGKISHDALADVRVHHLAEFEAERRDDVLPSLSRATGSAP